MNAHFKKLSPRARAAAREGTDQSPRLGFNCLTGDYSRDKNKFDPSGVVSSL